MKTISREQRTRNRVDHTKVNRDQENARRVKQCKRQSYRMYMEARANVLRYGIVMARYPEDEE